jgi:hypothetical protein
MPLGLGLTAFSVFGGTFDLRGVIRPTWQESFVRQLLQRNRNHGGSAQLERDR